MAGFVFNAGADGLTSGGTIVWATDTIKVRPILASAAAAVDKDATSMTGIGTTGYDVTVTSKTKTKNTTDDRIDFDFADFSFLSVAAIGAIDHYAVFKFVTNDAGSTPISKIEMTSVTPNGGNVDVAVATARAFSLNQ